MKAYIEGYQCGKCDGTREGKEEFVYNQLMMRFHPKKLKDGEPIEAALIEFEDGEAWEISNPEYGSVQEVGGPKEIEHFVLSAKRVSEAD